MRPLLAAALACACLAPAGAAEIESLTVTQHGARYRTEMAVRLAVSAEAAFAALTDYPGLGRINPRVRAVEILSGEAPAPLRLRTLVELCVGILCRQVAQVQDMRRSAATTLQAEVVPALSDLHYGVAHWRFLPLGADSRLHFDAEIEPKFWVPPFIGPWLVKRALTREAIATSSGIEQAARGR